MNRILQLIWILASFSIIIESTNLIDVEVLLSDLTKINNYDYANSLQKYTVKGGTKVIVAKCYNINNSQSNSNNGHVESVSYKRYEDEDNTKIKWNYAGNFYWMAFKIPDDGVIYCGQLTVNGKPYYIGYKILFDNADNANIKEVNSLSQIPQGKSFLLSRRDGLTESLKTTSIGDSLYTFKEVELNAGTYQISEAIHIAEFVTPPITTERPRYKGTRDGPEGKSNIGVVGKKNVDDDYNSDNKEDKRKNSTDKIGVFPSIIFSIMFIINKIIH